MIATIQAFSQFNEGATEENVAIVSEAFDIEPELLEKMCWQPMAHDASIDLTSMQDFAQWSYDREYIDELIDFADYYDTRYIDYANAFIDEMEEDTGD